MKKIIDKELVGKVRRWNLFSCKVEGKKGDYAMIKKDFSVEGCNGVVCFGIDKYKNIALIQNYRLAVENMAYGFPRGSTEKGEDIEETALKEFKEEIGIQEDPKIIIKLGEIFPDDGILNFKLAIYLLEFDDFSKYDVWGETDGSYEDIYEKAYVSFEKFKKMINDGIIKDSYSLGAYALYISKY